MESGPIYNPVLYIGAKCETCLFKSDVPKISLLNAGCFKGLVGHIVERSDGKGRFGVVNVG